MNKLSSEIKRELEARGLTSLKQAATFIGVSTETLRGIINLDYVPKDTTLRIIADKLGLDMTELILAAHRQKLPEAQDFFLSPAAPSSSRRRRVYPLSQEQCGYLGKIMSLEEIHLVRKYRQLDSEGKIQFMGYLDYHFALHRAALQKTEIVQGKEDVRDVVTETDSGI